jgi:hypothetical protein
VRKRDAARGAKAFVEARHSANAAIFISSILTRYLLLPIEFMGGHFNFQQLSTDQILAGSCTVRLGKAKL